MPATRKKKTAVRKKSARRATKRLAPRREKRGLNARDMVLDLNVADIAPLADEVRAVGGAPVGAYREPLSGRALLLATLPVEAVEPTPFQRDLSPTHARRLADKIEEAGAFLDPLIVVRGADGKLWTPNGRHRLAAARLLGLRQILALVSPDEGLAFRILALNTEKAHNLRDKSLEVIRMARALAKRQPNAREADFSAEFEAPEFLTLGVLYEENSRFGGSVYVSFLRKVDRFSDRRLAMSLRQRADLAARLAEIDQEVRKLVAGLEKRGFRSPYLRSFVVARINPVRFHKLKKGDRTPPMTIAAALTRMLGAARKFNLDTVKMGDLALVAAVAGGED